MPAKETITLRVMKLLSRSETTVQDGYFSLRIATPAANFVMMGIEPGSLTTKEAPDGDAT
jgi:hypothetical protein